jgi:hypothetical protein
MTFKIFIFSAIVLNACFLDLQPLKAWTDEENAEAGRLCSAHPTFLCQSLGQGNFGEWRAAHVGSMPPADATIFQAFIKPRLYDPKVYHQVMNK